ncbi:hypothetical protein IV498_02310 [Paenarthrobacter sp. Z7-10]|uniref:hypothetical protein n=1 Tax=Paenarthrobacter sp. Z7-10 TaxID=2787635 RepID=UPI0022A972F3|nr:hypothetical protein [Paenarthrobacter sp. Z7-10]MCZ2402045.1 hypothetical protein [Paenarthrobacter sp. Z7-10]
MAAHQPQFFADQACSDTTGNEGPEDPAEHFHGYAVLGLPFSSGYYLAFRHWPSSSVGPGYRAVWVRTPDRRWTIYADVAPELSCARYFGSAIHSAVTAPVSIDWSGPSTARIQVPRFVDWQLQLAGSAATAMLTAMATSMPAPLWRRESLLRAMGAMAGGALRAGKMSVSGTVPNGQSFQAQPRRLWLVRDSRAIVDGCDVGEPGPLPEQDRLGSFWLPQRGLFAADLGIRFPSTAPGALPESAKERSETH